MPLTSFGRVVVGGYHLDVSSGTTIVLVSARSYPRLMGAEHAARILAPADDIYARSRFTLRSHHVALTGVYERCTDG